MLDLTNVHGATTEQQLGFQLKYERNPPTTQNLDDLAALRDKHLSFYNRKVETLQAAMCAPVSTEPGIPSGTLPWNHRAQTFSTN